jgi:dinuclear metal center YbgI/SA1388 family protein
MARTSDIVAFLDDLLQPDRFADYGPNGLQVPGADEVDTVVTGVSGQLELFERAADLGAQMVLVHHGILWDFHPRRIDVRMARRLRALFDADINLVAHHLPLDAHPDVGNNALIAEALGCTKRTQFGEYKGQLIGAAGEFDGDGLPATALFERVQAITEREPLVFDAGPDVVRRVAIVSGSAASNLPEAIAGGFDAFITGEPSEHVMADAREAGLHFIAAGHYATETFGVKRLGEMLSARFGVAHRFVDIPNPI